MSAFSSFMDMQQYIYYSLDGAQFALHSVMISENAFPPSTASEMLFEGATVDEAYTWLRSNIGPPVTDFETPGNIEGDASMEHVYLVEQTGRRG